MNWITRRRTITFERPLVMGIINVTPDSFSDGGQFRDPQAAVEHAMQLVEDGADILDIGGESTRPGAEPLAEQEELGRVKPVVAVLAKIAGVPISIDTMKPNVARQCFDVGAEIVNDVSGLRDPAMVQFVRESRAAAIVMHMQGTPQTMQVNPKYDDVVGEVAGFFRERLKTLTNAGVALEAITFDPGIGFGKKSMHNWQLIGGLRRFQEFGRPMVLGVSRKGFLGKDREPTERVAAGLAVACFGAITGGMQIVRTHEVRATRDALNALAHIPQ